MTGVLQNTSRLFPPPVVASHLRVCVCCNALRARHLKNRSLSSSACCPLCPAPSDLHRSYPTAAWTLHLLPPLTDSSRHIRALPLCSRCFFFACSTTRITPFILWITCMLALWSFAVIATRSRKRNSVASRRSNTLRCWVFLARRLRVQEG